MDDPILSNEPAPAAAQAPPQADNRMDRLESAMAQLTDTVRDAASALRSSPPQQGPQQTPDEFMNDLAANPQGTIERVATRAAQAMAAQQLNPAVLQVLDTANAQLMNGHRQKVDSELGDGTFDEIFKPQLDKDIAQLRQINPKAVADPATLEALVNRLYGGDNFPVLMDRRRTLEKTAQVRGLSHLLPSGGVPRLRVGNPLEEIPPDAETFLRDVEKSTGENVDRKHFAKLYHTGVDSGPGRHRTSLIDYLKATGADADKLKSYGGS